MQLVDRHNRPYPFFMADSPTEHGGLRESTDQVASDTAVLIARQISALPQYQVLSELLPSKRLDLFLEKRINTSIFPVVRSLCAMEWYIQHGQRPNRAEIVWKGHRGLGQALQEVWPSDLISLKCGPAQETGAKIRSWAVGLRNRFRNVMGKGDPGYPEPATAVHQPATTIVAVHHVEGTDLERRSDLFWFPSSGIDPSRVMIYFDDIAAVPVKSRAQVIKRLESLGMRWTQLKSSATGRPGWSPNASRGTLLERWQNNNRGKSPSEALQRWLAAEAVAILTDVEYWLSFYKEFNVKIHIELGEGTYNSNAQCIAADMIGQIHVGRERSDSWGPGTLGHHPDHVYFVWNQRGALCAEVNRNRVDSAIISGFPHDSAWSSHTEPQKIKSALAAKGVSFVVALFDNGFWWGGVFSKSMMSRFYIAFLDWVINDPRVGVITKSKKPVVLDDLPELKHMMEQAVATGRWINLDDVTGRLPSDASRAADVSVGIGISSAVTEAVAAGSRGVHCDLTGVHNHPFYQWGYEKVIFDDLDRMMAAFKIYKTDHSELPAFGDFSNHMKEVDPYADGRSGERAGTYLRWLLESTDQGNDRESALRQADKKFSQRWGKDSVIHTYDELMPDTIS